MYDPDFWTCDIEESFIRVVFGGRVAWRPAAYAIFDTFAAVLSNGSVITWGSPEYGGDRSAVQDQLVHVQEIQSANSAFAAIRTDAGMFEVIVCCCKMFSDLR